MSRGHRFLAAAGLVVLAGAGVLRLLDPGSGAAALPLAVLGVALLLGAFFRGGRELERFLGRRSTREGGSLLGTSLFLLASLVLVNVLAARFVARVDLTHDRLFTLAPETLAALRRSPVPPRITLFYPADHPTPAALRPLLDAVQQAEPRVAVQVVDPRQEPLAAFAFDLPRRAPEGMATVVEVGDRHELFPGATEAEFTGALLRALRQRTPRVGFVGGHGEGIPNDRTPQGLGHARDALTDRGYRVASPVDVGRGGLDTLDVLVLAGAQAPLAPAEEDTILSYLERGGRVLLLVDPVRRGTPERVLGRAGLRVASGVLADPALPEPRGIVPDYARHPVTRALLDRQIRVYLPGAAEIVLDAAPPGVRRIPLLRTGTQTRVEGAAGPTAAAARVVAAVALWPARSGRETRLLVVGDADFPTDSYLETYGNADLFLSAVEWLAEEEAGIELRARTHTDRPIFMTRPQGRILWVLCVLLLPVGVLTGGTAVWWKRR